MAEEAEVALRSGRWLAGARAGVLLQMAPEEALQGRPSRVWFLLGRKRRGKKGSAPAGWSEAEGDGRPSKAKWRATEGLRRCRRLL